tara:strand:- start:26459 stop:26704 length:246 start_codon:yes stop_codon:yes gene_type:complete
MRDLLEVSIRRGGKTYHFSENPAGPLMPARLCVQSPSYEAMKPGMRMELVNRATKHIVMALDAQGLLTRSERQQANQMYRC